MNQLKVFSLLIFLFSQNFLTGQEISIFPGLFKQEFYVDDRKVSCKEVENLIAKNNEANILWQKSKKYQWAAGGLSVAEAGLAIYALNKASNGNQESALTPVYAAVGVGIVSVIFSYNFLKLRKNSILKYNKSFDNKSHSYISPSSSGIGLALNF
jgi:hypothetical protein